MPITKVGDEGLEDLSRFASLTYLDLAVNNITDAGLAKLYGLSKLRRLELTRTQATEKGIAQLRKALPKCEILTNSTDP